MADTADETRATLERQINDLKSEITKISKSLGERAADAADAAEDMIDEGRGRARTAVRHVRRQAHAAADLARENPGTTATVLSTVGLLGLAAGMILGGLFAGGNNRR